MGAADAAAVAAVQEVRGRVLTASILASRRGCPGRQLPGSVHLHGEVELCVRPPSDDLAGSARKRRSRRQQQSEEPADPEVVVLEDDEQQQQQQPAGDGGKKRRRIQRMQG